MITEPLPISAVRDIRAGDVVTHKNQRGTVRDVRVSHVITSSSGQVYWVGIKWQDDRGKIRYSEVRPETLVRVKHVSHTTANVYADYLEEHGEWKAAQMLREAFPLDDGRENYE